MSEPVVTEADREKAEVALWGPYGSQSGMAERVASALAAERAKAREPFLALAEEYERHASLMQAAIDSGSPPDVVMRSQAFRDAGASIRRAAEETA